MHRADRVRTSWLTTPIASHRFLQRRVHRYTWLFETRHSRQVFVGTASSQRQRTPESPAASGYSH
uniref:Uncharacterized protein n=1 Tax=Paraburkholderia sprentiae WSM5005 TaxID=754502 RepID=A0A1I9YLG3_9BURK